MPYHKYYTTNYRVGVVKTYSEEKGFGFIVKDKLDGFGELFFHKKSTKCAVAEKDLVLYIKTTSSKYADKDEAVKVIKVVEYKEYLKLVQLYLKYGYFKIFHHALTMPKLIASSKLEDEIFVPIIENEFASIDNEEKYRRALRLIQVIKEDKSVTDSCALSCLKKLLFNSGEYEHLLYLSVHKVIKDDAEVQRKQFDALKIYKSLSPDQQKIQFRNLTLTDRLKLKGVTQVSSVVELQVFLSVISVDNEDIVANFRSIVGSIEIKTFILPFLWEKGVLLEAPISALKESITLYNNAQLRGFLSKLSLNEKIAIFPTKFVEDKKGYDLYQTFINSCTDATKAVEIFEMAGIFLSPELYYKAIIDLSFKITVTGLTLLRAYLIDSPINDNTRLVKALGWRISIDLFSAEINQNQTKALLLILKNVSDFTLNDTSELDEKIGLTHESKLFLWYHNYTSAPSEKVIAAGFLTANTEEMSLSILKRANSVERILTVALDIFKGSVKAKTEGIVLRLLKACENLLPLKYAEFKHTIVKHSNDLLKLTLWLNDYSDFFDFDTFSIFFITLSSENQKRFLKKTMFEIKERKAEITIQSLLNLKNSTIDPEIARRKEFNGEKVDFTVFVILQAIEDLMRGEATRPEKMYKIIADQIQSPTELLILSGFFDKCKGRKIMDNNESRAGDGFHPLKKERGSIPRFIIYCEGRKAIQVDDGNPSICEKTGKEFWWCHNSKCYQNCIEIHSLWHDYTLLDMLNILKIQFSQLDYEMFLGYVNKVNKFLEHMKCKECNHILKPLRKDEKPVYGFYRVSNFSCDNDSCTQKGLAIYLSHCINGHCGSVIDSRDSVRCKPAEKPGESCGWYICNDCYACCNSEGIKGRKYIMEKTNQIYNCHQVGHREKGIICCPKCGTEMNASGYKEEDYKTVLNWFINNRNKSDFIINSGQRKDGKYWFLLKAPHWDRERFNKFKEKLYRYVSIGFNIPEIHEDKDAYLLGEAFNTETSHIRLLTCPFCNFKIDVRDDYEKYLSISKYHKTIKFSFS